MSVSLVNGDLIQMAKEYEFDLICHFCDCEKRWDSNLSTAIKNLYPLTYDIDTDSFPIDLGEYSVCNDYLFKIANIYIFCVDKDKEKTAYKALDQACYNINNKFNGTKIAMSYDQIIEIGLDWESVKKVLITNFKSLHLIVVKN